MTVACCRWAFAGGDTTAVHDLVAAIRFDRFLRTVRFHRVQGLVWKCLSALGDAAPSAVIAPLAADARTIAAGNLRIAVEARALRAAFADGGVAMLFVKGLTVGTLAYGDPFLKENWDVDLLIDPAALDEAVAVLRARGYRLVLPAASVRLRSWHRQRKESEWVNASGIHVELHTRLADNRRLIPEIGVGSPSRDMKVAPKIALPTLRAEELFAYLSVHGASSLWFRLKWITDLAGILHHVDQVEIARMYVRSQELGAGRASAYALLLADRLYGTLEGSPLKAELARDRTSTTLSRLAFRQLASRPEPREPTRVRGGTAAIHVSQFLLLPGARFKLSELWRQARAALT